MISYENFASNCASIRKKIEEACTRAGRDPQSVKLLPVTKTHPAAVIDYVARQEDMLGVGENRVQEAIEKQAAAHTSLEWELIGHLQSNKAKLAVQHFDRIQSVDSEKLLDKINIAAEHFGKKQRILLQVNAGNDPQKFGLEPGDMLAAAKHALSLEHIQLEGLMTIPPIGKPDTARETFERLFDLHAACQDTLSIALPELSMGMTGDYEIAIQAGSTLVRIGSGLFGPRG